MTALFPIPPPNHEPLLDLVVPGRPVGAARPRFVRATGRTYMPDNSVKAEASAMVQIRDAWGDREPLDCPVALELEVVVARPQSLCRRKDPKGRVPCCSKPDIDNVAKLLLDAAVKAGVVVDDTRVVELVVRKQYTSLIPIEQPHVRITLRRVR